MWLHLFRGTAVRPATDCGCLCQMDNQLSDIITPTVSGEYFRDSSFRAYPVFHPRPQDAGGCHFLGFAPAILISNTQGIVRQSRRSLHRVDRKGGYDSLDQKNASG
jgi:hypothetical protein